MFSQMYGLKGLFIMRPWASDQKSVKDSMAVHAAAAGNLSFWGGFLCWLWVKRLAVGAGTEQCMWALWSAAVSPRKGVQSSPRGKALGTPALRFL